MIAPITRFWWLVALRGAVGILFGVVAIAWPGATLAALVLLFGAYMFVDGVLALAGAFRFRHDRDRWGALLLEGVLGIAIGAITFFSPGITALAWVFTIGAWAIVTGILEIAAAFRLKGALGTEILLGLSGIVSVLFGVAMMLLPLAGLIVWVLMIGVYAIVFGILLLVASIRLRAAAHGNVMTPSASAR
jgi:uncharacterized membrane protein HdeD (DUF308 family)